MAPDLVVVALACTGATHVNVWMGLDRCVYGPIESLVLFFTDWLCVECPLLALMWYVVRVVKSWTMDNMSGAHFLWYVLVLLYSCVYPFGTYIELVCLCGLPIARFSFCKGFCLISLQTGKVLWSLAIVFIHHKKMNTLYRSCHSDLTEKTLPLAPTTQHYTQEFSSWQVRSSS
jgi:hypothetical protein